MRNPLLLGVLCLTLTHAPVRAAELDKHLPDDTQGVVCINVRQLVGAPVIRKELSKYLDEVLKRDKVQAFLEEIDLNVIQDVHRVVMATPHFNDAPPAGEEPRARRDLAIVYGKFNVAKIRKKADGLVKDSLIKAHKIDGHIVYQTALPDEFAVGGNKELFLCIADDSTLLVGEARAALVDALEKHDGKKKTKPAKALASLIEKVDDTQTIWFAIHGEKELATFLLNPPNLFRLGKREEGKVVVVDISGGLTFAKDARLNLNLLVDTEDNAKVVGRHAQVGINMLVGLSAYFSLVDEKNREFLTISETLKGVKVKQEARQVSVALQLSGKEFEQLIDLDRYFK